ncbi:MAG: nickel pincer cofactor biosynthesis protein LarC [Nitrospirae bacterium]|nr:nickel pincer cofactor biosynthesis protein LarC [Nitrospirota bacterium]
MTTAYFQCASGVSGDMCLGALIHAGVPLNEINKELKRLHLKGYTLTEKKVRRKGIEAIKITVKINDKKHLNIRRWRDVVNIVRSSDLEPEIKEKGLRIFKSLFLSEAIAHGEPYDRLHVHELGSVDTFVDIFGTLIALKALGIEKVYTSAVNLGGGSVRMSHGVFPVPAPATAELLKGIPQYSVTGTPYELTTPTGAAIIKAISSGFGGMPLMSVDKIGIGAGDRDLKEMSNVLRVFIGKDRGIVRNEDITVIETNIDDMSPQIYEYLIEKLLKKGALDAFLTQVIMKKGRPGVLLTVLCHEDKKQEIANTIFEETTTLGVRFYNAGRITLKRKIDKVVTEFGKIRVKMADTDTMRKVMPEYEFFFCRRL